MAIAPLQRIPVLHTDVWRMRVAEHEELNQALLAEIKQHQQSQPEPIAKSNPGCWRGVSNYSAFDALLPTIREATLSVLNRYCSEDARLKPPIDTDAAALDVFYWTNVNPQGSANDLHSHEDAGDMAGVYYVQGCGTGEIIFRSENCRDEARTDHLPFTNALVYAPRDGDLLLFPSYLKHAVAPNPSDRERINLAFNVTVVKKGSGPLGLSRQRNG